MLRTYFELDSNGIPFLVMKEYDTFFSQILDTQGTKSIDPETALRYTSDIVEGIFEFHDAYGRAHCDLKPDNLAVDKNGKILLADFGTAAYTAEKASPFPRDSMGHLYTRSPKQFRKGAHPQKSSDCYALGSLLFRLLTGKYPHQDEIDEALRTDGVSKVEEVMQEFTNDGLRYTTSSKFHFTPEFYSAISNKLENQSIPEELKEFLTSCLTERYTDGARLKE